MPCRCKCARLAVQIGNETNAQANVQIDVEFGKKKIRNALQQSLDDGEVTYLSEDIDSEQGVCMKLIEFAYTKNDCSMITNQDYIYEVATDPISVIFIQSFFMRADQHA